LSEAPTSSFARRTAEDYQEGFAALLPTGPAWPRDPESVLMQVLLGQAAIWERVDGRAADMIEIESDPRFTTEMLDSWEAAYGLPDPCTPEPGTVAARRRALLDRMTTMGGQSRAFFIALAALLGFTITITERAPFMCGVSRCGDPDRALGPPEIRFLWTVHVGPTALKWFRVGAGGGQVGVDPHLRIALAYGLECVLRRWRPAHTNLIFDYSGALAA
jgi:uncharacterized protein YmfQ (DUF2313 family)